MNRRAIGTVALLLLVVVGGSVFVAERHVQRQALQQEDAYVQSQLAANPCVRNYGTSGTTGRPDAAVADWALDGMWVRVSHPYWYDTNQTHADTTSEAVYYVGLNSVYRVDGESPGPVC